MGQKIKRKDIISAVGSTGRSSGPHLHYEVRVNDIPVDPINYILDE
jgi:murein DD-endopeptidase MepM/ murein hydrolase activator NlpD